MGLRKRQMKRMMIFVNFWSIAHASLSDILTPPIKNIRFLTLIKQARFARQTAVWLGYINKHQILLSGNESEDKLWGNRMRLQLVDECSRCSKTVVQPEM